MIRIDDTCGVAERSAGPEQGSKAERESGCKTHDDQV